MADADLLPIHFTLDGRETDALVDKKATALPLLRGQLSCSTLKAGCDPQGVCGCCAAVVGGKVRLTCTLPAKALDGKEVVTQAGLEPELATTVARAFAVSGLAQEGYAVPGMLMAFIAAREAAGGEPLDVDTALKALNLHVTRSFGWTAAGEAFVLADQALRGEVDLDALAGEDGVPAHLVQAALGRRPSVDDLHRPGMLHAAVVFAPHARCRIDRIDAAAALAMDGVVAVLTAADLQGATTHGVCQSDWPVLVGVGQSTRGASDLVAVVAATTREQARAAAAAVVVHAEALSPETDVLHAAGDPERIVHRVELSRGEPRKALEASAHQARAHVETRGSDPAFVEPEAALAVPLDDGRYRVHACGQDLFRDLEQLCGIGSLLPDQLELVHLPAGGAFGGRLDLGITGHALLLAQATGRPVKLALDMAESTRLHAGRHPTWTNLQLSCDDQGKLTALRARVVLDTGGHTGAGPMVADTIARHLSLAYQVPDAEIDVLCVRSDNPASGASPGMGVPEYAFALETVLDRLAAQAGLDPLELRRRNLLQPGEVAPAGWTVPADFAPGRVLDALAEERARLQEQGLTVGIALGAYAHTLPEDLAMAEVEVKSAGHVLIHTGFSEVGQGFDTRAIRAAAAASGLPAEVFEVRSSTARDVPCGPTLGGRDRRLGLPAVAAAAGKLRQALDGAGGALSALVGQSYAAEVGLGPAIGLSGQACGIAEDGGIAELAVVVDTGSDPVDRHARGFLAGAAELGLELAVTAEREVLEGALPETRWTKLGILKARHVPPVHLRLVAGPASVPTEDAVVVATPAAVANALAAARGEWPEVLPMKDGEHAKKMGIRQVKK